MNKNILHHVIFSAALLLLAACTQDDPMGDNGTTLPEGVYPLEISSVALEAKVNSQPWGADSPQTRVTENDERTGSVWQNGDKINVQIGDGTPGVYTYTDGRLEVTNGDAPAYWASTVSGQHITAWYTPSGSETVDLSNQVNGLAHVLTAQTIADFNKSVSLSFSHALAKVRVVPEGEKKDEVTDVHIKTYTSCTLNTDGTLSAGDEGYIPMVKTTHEGEKCWEANVVPGHTIAQFEVNGTEGKLSPTVNPQKGKVHEINITLNKKIPEITGGEISEPGNYIMKGNITESVTLNASGINLTLDNVQSNTDGAPIIIGNNAQVTLNILGTANSLTSTNGNGIEIREGASLTITGKGKDASKLVVKASEKTPDITALRAGIGPSTGNVSIKTITISNVHLVVSGGKAEWNGSGPAAIGLCSVNDGYQQSCDGISITDSKIEAASYGGACIGTGSVSNSLSYTQGKYTLGPIIIKGSEIRATANENGYSGECGSCIGFGLINVCANGVIKGITIDNSTLNLTVASNSAYKVGRGKVLTNADATYSITDGIVVDGQKKGNDDGWNP